MCRLLGVMCNNPERLGCFLYSKRNIYRPDPEGYYDGYGIGYYNDFRALIFKKPLSRVKIDKSCYEIAREIKSETLIVHLRNAGSGPCKIENTHPFRFRNFIFAHIGSIYNFSKIDTKMYFKLPDFLMRNIQGETDSELLFHLILAELYHSQNLDNADIRGEDIVKAILRAIRVVEDIAGTEDLNKSSFTSIFSNGEYLVGVAAKEPLYLGKFNSITDCAICEKRTKGTDTDILAEQHKNFRAVVLLGGEIEGMLDNEKPVKDRSIVLIKKDLTEQIFPI